MTEEDKIFLQQFYMNEPVREAVQRFLLDYLSIGEWTDERFPSNENLGAIVRASLEGKRLVREGFKKLSRFKTEPEKEIESNPAR